jgi:hypothetical protein
MEVQYPTLDTKTYLSHPGVRFIHHVAEHVVIFKSQRACFKVILPCYQHIGNHVNDNERVKNKEARLFVLKV